MRFYIKTIARKILWLYKYPKYLYPSISSKKFPDQPISSLQIKAKLRGVKTDLQRRDFTHNLGALYPTGHSFSIKTYQDFMKFNTNHLGNWSIDEPGFGTQQLEYEVIHKIVNLYHADKEGLEGYLTSGGTEGNLFAMWLAKSYLSTKADLNKIVLLRTSLTHYSVEKSAEITSIEQDVVALNSKDWTIDKLELERTILKHIANGKKAFILALTHGYTETGTNDNLDDVNSVINRVTKKSKNIYFSTFIDASLGGLVTPFLTSNFKPFKYKHIHTYVTDFHKFMGVPYPAGLILYRSGLRKYIEKIIKYVDKKDNTIAGSRPGTPAAATWALIHKLGKSEFENIAKRQIKLKNYFISNLKKISPNIEIINNPTSLSCGVIFKDAKNQKLSENIERKYWLHANNGEVLFDGNKKREIVIYKFFFLPHMEPTGVNHFLKDLKEEIK